MEGLHAPKTKKANDDAVSWRVRAAMKYARLRADWQGLGVVPRSLREGQL